MYPGLRPGDVIVAERVPRQNVTPGCILCVDDRDRRVVHRVIRTEPSDADILVVCKGDNLPEPDEPVLVPGDSCWQVSLIIRNGGFRKPRRGRIHAFLSINNLTAGMFMKRIKRVLQWMPPPVYDLTERLRKATHHDTTG
jgi:hypothetical protein